MQSLMQQTQAIAALAADMNQPATACCHCTPLRACWYHRRDAIRTRRMTRAQWLTLRHEQREHLRELDAQERDEDEWRNSTGYAMPYSVRLSKGYAE